MVHPNDIHSLTDFRKNAKSWVERLRTSGRPVVLTVNGKAAVVVQDPASYQRLLELAERAEVLEALRESSEDIAAGRTRPAGAFLDDMRRKHKIPPGACDDTE